MINSSKNTSIITISTFSNKYLFLYCDLFFQPTTLIDGDSQAWKTIFDVNVLGLCIATREAVKSMKENNIDGHIIHINSIAGHKIPLFPGLNVYPASKHAITALTETLRIEFNTLGLKIKITVRKALFKLQ